MDDTEQMAARVDCDLIRALDAWGKLHDFNQTTNCAVSVGGWALDVRKLTEEERRFSLFMNTSLSALGDFEKRLSSLEKLLAHGSSA